MTTTLAWLECRPCEWMGTEHSGSATCPLCHGPLIGHLGQMPEVEVTDEDDDPEPPTVTTEVYPARLFAANPLRGRGQARADDRDHFDDNTLSFSVVVNGVVVDRYVYDDGTMHQIVTTYPNQTRIQESYTKEGP